MECDDKVFMEYMEGKTQPEIYCNVPVEDIRVLIKKVGCNRSNFVPRNANKVAHEMAHGPNCISIRHTPEHIHAIVERDVIE